MGCDIHFHTEIKINGRWEHYSHPNVRRNYSLFSLLAGVRSSDENQPPFKSPAEFLNVLPKDVNPVTLIDYNRWQGDAHNLKVYTSQDINELYTYIDEKEIRLYPGLEALSLCLEDYTGYLFGNGWDIIKYRDEKPAEIEDVRWIFWFDN